MAFWEEFIGDYLLLMSGHHWWPFSAGRYKGLNNDHYLAQKLKADYGGFVVRLTLNFTNIREKYVIVLNHGNGGAVTPGSAVNKRYKIHQGFDADMVVQGHDNTRVVGCHNFMGRDGGWVEKRSVGIGAHEMAYPDSVNDQGYVEKAMMLPKTLGNTMHCFEEFNGKLWVRSWV